MATIKDVAAKAGVSTTTVSRILNDYSPVNRETKKRVLRVMEELNYRPSSLAQGMRRQRSRTIGVIIPTYTNYWYADFLNYIELEARSHGYLPVVCTHDIESNSGHEHINELIRRQVDGCILCWYHGIADTKKYLNTIVKETPLVIMDQSVDNLPASSVFTDGYKGMKEMVTALIERGHRRIAVMKFKEEHATTDSRFQGYLDALKENNIEIRESYIVGSDYSIESGYQAAQTVLNTIKPTALAAVGDFMAIGALRYCRDAEIRVPEDISITGFDDVPFARVVSPSLTTVSQPIEEMARIATKQLLKKIENRRTKNREFVLDTKITFRESTNIER